MASLLPEHQGLVMGAVSDLRAGPWDGGRVARVVGVTAAGVGLYAATGGAALAVPTATGFGVGISMALGPGGLLAAGIIGALGAFFS